MSRDRARKSSRPSALDEARDELFSHIHRCAVMKATREQQEEWMKDTIEFLGERHPGLTTQELKELETIGMRFCSPVISYADEASADGVGAEREAAAA